MKRITLMIVVLLLLMLISACDSGQKINNRNLQSTDLSDIDIGGIKIGNNTNYIDMSLFSHTESQNDLFTFWFKEIGIKSTDDGLVTEIHVREPREIDYSINGRNDFTTVEQIKDEMGQYYNDYRFDSEQELRAITYSDKENNTNFTLVYANGSNNIIWLILSDGTRAGLK